MYFALFVVQFTFGTALVVHGEIVNDEGAGFLGSVRVNMQGLGLIAVGSAGSSISITEFGRLVMVLSRRLEETVRKMKEERLALIEERRAQGRAEAHALWEAWNERRMEAEAEGRPFDEPPPSANGRNGANGRDGGREGSRDT